MRWPRKKDGKKAKPAGKADDSGIKIVARNRRARHDYELLEKVEAGLVLTGTEVKSLRNGKANLEDAYAEVDTRRGLAARLRHPRVPPGQPDEPRPQATAQAAAPPPRDRQARRQDGRERDDPGPDSRSTSRRGSPRSSCCVAKGRKTFDKREAIKKQDAKRDIDRAMRRR